MKLIDSHETSQSSKILIMPRAIRGVLVQCDPSIKSIIVKINSDRNEYIIEELDDQTLVIKENMLGELKRKLDEVLKETQNVPDESDQD